MIDSLLSEYKPVDSPVYGTVRIVRAAGTIYFDKKCKALFRQHNTNKVGFMLGKTDVLLVIGGIKGHSAFEVKYREKCLLQKKSLALEILKIYNADEQACFNLEVYDSSIEIFRFVKTKAKRLNQVI